MNKKIKKIITFTVLAGGAMYAFNEFIDYTSVYRGLTLDDDENYYHWRNGTVFYKKKGNGKPLLLIHDLNPVSSSYEWSNLIDRLSETNTVYAIDLLGCGKSDKPSFTYVNYLYVQLLNDFIKDIINDKTDIMVTGESFSFVIMAARMNKKMIGKITAINPTDISYNVKLPSLCGDLIKHSFELPIIGTFIYNLLTNTKCMNNKFTEKYFHDKTKIPINLIDKYIEAAHLQKSNGKYLYASIIGKYTNINIIHAIKYITNPIHFITTNDIDKDIREYMNYNDYITIDHISDAGYLPQLEKPEDIIRIIQNNRKEKDNNE